MTGVIVDEWGTARTDGMRWLIPPIQEHTDQPEYLSRQQPAPPRRVRRRPVGNQELRRADGCGRGQMKPPPPPLASPICIISIPARIGTRRGPEFEGQTPRSRPRNWLRSRERSLAALR